MRLVRCGVWQFRACEGSAGCASTTDRSESFVGTPLLLVRAPRSLWAELLVDGGAVAEGVASYFVHTLKISLVRALRLQTLTSEGEGRGRCKGAPGKYSKNLIIFFRV